MGASRTLLNKLKASPRKNRRGGKGGGASVQTIHRRKVRVGVMGEACMRFAGGGTTSPNPAKVTCKACKALEAA